MNENTKTFSLIFAAVALLFVAFASRPSIPESTSQELVGKPLFPELDDALKVKRMRIETFDEGTSRARRFEVAQNGQNWSLPSHKNYPADAKDQVKDAVSALFGVKYLGPPVTTSTTDHELYGVVEPKQSADQFGQKGVGKKIELEDGSGKPLARIIIGKEDKSPKAGDEFTQPQTQLRFVRIPGQDAVYRVALRTDKFSSNFADWIETDLLKLQPWDISSIKLRDYSVTDAVTQTGQYSPILNKRADIDLTFDDKTQKWNLKELIEYKGKNTQNYKLAEDEELNTVKLNDLKNGLATLKIMDVARKPEKMSANLKADKSLKDDLESLRNLVSKGLLPIPKGDDEMEIVSSDGEATVQMKDGVEYLLRFGAVAGIDNAADEDKKKAAEAGKADEKSADEKAGEKAADAKDAEDKPADKAKGGLSRYIMVMAQFNPDLLPKPELEPLPEIKKAPVKTDEAKAETKKGGTKSGAKSTDTKGAAKGDAKSADAKSAKSDDKKGATSAKDSKADEAKKSGEKSADEKKSAAKEEAAVEEDQEALEAQHDKIEKENRRKQEAYDEKVKAGQQKAKELNSRFADWYYVVGDETYRKIHLNKADIVKKKTAADVNAAPAGHNIPTNPFHLQGVPGAGS